jgi:diketogulonate reductase-like aldo/keto reductase
VLKASATAMPRPRPLGSGLAPASLLRHQVEHRPVARLHHYNKTVPQVVYRFAFELGMLPLTGTTDVAHMRDSLDIFDFTLTHDEIETLLALRGLR